MNKRLRALRLVLLLSLLAPLMGSGSIITEVFDRHWIKKAEFIFLGEVVKIEYKSSLPTQEGDTPIPHTFVTCAIQDVYKGKAPMEGNLTLRFQGGKSVIKPDRYLDIPGIPLFNLGDQGIFFVRMNGESLCPLVGFYQGIIRLINNQVFNGLGQELRVLDNLSDAAEAKLFEFHPYDILDYETFEAKLRQPNRAVDEIMRINLSPVLLGAAGARVRTTPPLGVSTPLQRLMPLQLRIPTLSSENNLLVRQLNQTLKLRRLFIPETVRDVFLRENTKMLLQRDPLNLSNAELILLNRRILEDAYPDLIIKSVEKPILPLGEPLLASQPYSIGGTNLQRQIFTAEGEGGSGPVRQPAPIGSPLNVDSLKLKIRETVAFLHTPEELNALPAVENLNIAANFSVPLLPMADAPQTIQENLPEPVTEEDRLERDFLLNNQNDPRAK